MKQSESKFGVRAKVGLLKTIIKFNMQKDLAYALNNWGNISSTLLYTLTAILFVDIIYKNVSSVAGYTYNEMLLLFFFFQITFYLNWYFNSRALFELIEDVNKGNLDVYLIKPVPSYFYLMSRNISIIPLLSDAIPAMTAIIIAINWQALNTNIINIILAILTNIMGIIVLRGISLLAAAPVFWLGESQSILDLATNISSSSSTLIPLEGYPTKLKITLSSVIPLLIPASFATSILLGKSNIYILFTWAIIITVLSLLLTKFIWGTSLKQYQSASS